MRILGIISTWLGLIASVIGLVVGFWLLVKADTAAMMWLSFVPLGFVGLLLGVTLTQLAGKQ